MKHFKKQHVWFLLFFSLYTSASTYSPKLLCPTELMVKTIAVSESVAPSSSLKKNDVLLEIVDVIRGQEVRGKLITISVLVDGPITFTEGEIKRISLRNRNLCIQ